MTKCQECGKNSKYLVGNQKVGKWLCGLCDEDVEMDIIKVIKTIKTKTNDKRRN